MRASGQMSAAPTRRSARWTIPLWRPCSQPTRSGRCECSPPACRRSSGRARSKCSTSAPASAPARWQRTPAARSATLRPPTSHTAPPRRPSTWPRRWPPSSWASRTRSPASSPLTPAGWRPTWASAAARTHRRSRWRTPFGAASSGWRTSRPRRRARTCRGPARRWRCGRTAQSATARRWSRGEAISGSPSHFLHSCVGGINSLF
mmetsp:Transcript_38284/g.123896  ORF Transcript_38284/g.123896 Transcript_38284/m.123896 type:complete len:205 (-) Transcript_38284:1372-1986(-)